MLSHLNAEEPNTGGTTINENLIKFHHRQKEVPLASVQDRHLPTRTHQPLQAGWAHANGCRGFVQLSRMEHRRMTLAFGRQIREP